MLLDKREVVQAITLHNEREIIYPVYMAVRRIVNRWWLDFYQNGKRVRESVTIPGKEPKDVTKTEALKSLAIKKA